MALLIINVLVIHLELLMESHLVKMNKSSFALLMDPLIQPIKVLHRVHCLFPMKVILMETMMV